LWYEGGTLRSIGLSRREFGPALVVVTGFLILLNLIVVGLVLLREARLSIGLFALYRSAPLNSTRTLIAVGAVSEYVFVGPVEELAFRGYLQNKLVVLLDTGYSRLDTALGVVGAAVTLSILHVPAEILLDGLPLSQVAGSLVLFVATGVAFGAIYAVTRNL
jgi:membrane protease YdiL (CAAX protease family)